MGGGNYTFWLGASAEPSGLSQAEPEVVSALSGFDPSRWYGRAVARCMGGRFCRHGPGECTADPEYQRFCDWHKAHYS